MNANVKLTVGVSVLAAIAYACSPAAATNPPTGAAATPTSAPASAPAGTSGPATSGPTTGPGAGVPGSGFVLFIPTAGATPKVRGGATLTAASGQTQVAILVVASGTMAASIQAGTCDNLKPEIAYRLTNIVDGESMTTLNVDLNTLFATPYAINISVAGSETESSLACGEIAKIT